MASGEDEPWGKDDGGDGKGNHGKCCSEDEEHEQGQQRGYGDRSSEIMRCRRDDDASRDAGRDVGR